jgi:hypothetical protein
VNSHLQLKNHTGVLAIVQSSTNLCLDCGECSAGDRPFFAPCDPTSPSQHWQAANSTAEARYRCDKSSGTPTCVESPGDSYSKPQCDAVCRSDTHEAPAWMPAPPAAGALGSDPASIQLIGLGGHCLRVSGSDYSFGPALLMAPCEEPWFSIEPGYVQRRSWALVHTADALQLASLAVGCCGTIFQRRAQCLALDRYPSCATDARLAAMPFCDQRLGAEARARDLVSRLTGTRVRSPGCPLPSEHSRLSLPRRCSHARLPSNRHSLRPQWMRRQPT